MQSGVMGVVLPDKDWGTGRQLEERAGMVGGGAQGPGPNGDLEASFAGLVGRGAQGGRGGAHEGPQSPILSEDRGPAGTGKRNRPLRSRHTTYPGETASW